MVDRVVKDIEKKIGEKSRGLNALLRRKTKNKSISIDRYIDERAKNPKEVLTIRIVMEDGKKFQREVDIFKGENKKNINLLTTPVAIICDEILETLDKKYIN